MNRRAITAVLAGLVTGIALAFATGLAGCGSSELACEGDHCICPPDPPSSHACTTGGNACEVQCAPGEPCSTSCAAGEHCHVECDQASSCTVDCGSSPDCQVTCPATGCTVKSCTAGTACQVSCGLGSLPSR